MTRKHYEAIADVFKHLSTDDTAEHYKQTLVRLLATTFAQDNPKFQRTRFLEACGLFTLTCKRHNVPQGDCADCRHDEDKTCL